MSLFLPEINAVFVHIPRTGGSWVKQALATAGLECRHARGVGEHNLPHAYDHPGARRFCFVRDPLEWYESVWRGLHSCWPNRRAVKPLHRERTFSPIRMISYLASAKDHVDFARAVMREQPGFCSRMYEWYVGPPGFPLVDYVGSTAHLHEHLDSILFDLGWRGTIPALPRANVGEGDKIDWAYTPALTEQLRASEAYYARFREPGPWRVTADA